MLIPMTDRSASSGSVPMPGQQMAREIQDDRGTVLYREIYDLLEAPVRAGTSGVGLRGELAEEQWPDTEFKARLLATAPAPRASADPKAAVDAIRLAWDIIKDGRAITDLKGASTAILNPRNMNPFDYYEARRGQSGTCYWWGYNWPSRDWKAFEVWVRVSGTFGAKAPDDIPPGEYLPSVYVEFPKAPWAQWGLTMNGNVTITSPSNIGPKGHAIADCDVIATITVSSIFDPSRPQPFKFRANGKNGFS